MLALAHRSLNNALSVTLLAAESLTMPDFHQSVVYTDFTSNGYRMIISIMLLQMVTATVHWDLV